MRHVCGIASHAQFSIPIHGGPAQVNVPLGLLRAPARVVITETKSGSVIWQNGQYVAGCPGITGGRLSGKDVLFTVGSGDYTFRVTLT